MNAFKIHVHDLCLKNYVQLSAHDILMKKLWFCAGHLGLKKNPEGVLFKYLIKHAKENENL